MEPSIVETPIGAEAALPVTVWLAEGDSRSGLVVESFDLVDGTLQITCRLEAVLHLRKEG